MLNSKRHICQLTLLLLFLGSCNVPKHLHEDEYLLKKVKVKSTDKDYKTGELKDVMDVAVNGKFIWMPIRLWCYWSIDSLEVEQKKVQDSSAVAQRNEEQRIKVDSINYKRAYKALQKDSTTTKFKQKKYKPKEVNKRFKEWWRYDIGEAPKLYDTNNSELNRKRILNYLQKKGYYYATVDEHLDIDSNKRKVKIEYLVSPGKQYFIDSIAYLGTGRQESMARTFPYRTRIKVGQPLDAEALDNARSDMAYQLLNEDSYLGITAAHIYYQIDTISMGGGQTILYVGVKPKQEVNRASGETITKTWTRYRVQVVNFVFNDTMMMKDKYEDTIANLGLPMLTDDGYFTPLDTIQSNGVNYLYSGKPFVDTLIINIKNELDPRAGGKIVMYRQKFLEETYGRLISLGTFSSIIPNAEVISEAEGTIALTFILSPSKQHSFNVEPKAYLSAGVWGVGGDIGYTNKNLFRGAEVLNFNIGIGLESQPEILNTDGTTKLSAKLNTFDINPALTLKLPHFIFPGYKKMKISRWANPNTFFSIDYRYQDRDEFLRHATNFSWSYAWWEQRNRLYKLDLFYVSFININRSASFEEDLEELNDAYLWSTYSDRLIQGTKLTFTYDQSAKNPKIKNYFKFTGIVDIAGNVMYLTGVGKNNTDSIGQRYVFGVPFSQYTKFDSDSRYYLKKGRKHAIDFRIQIGAGISYGNSTIMPFESAFYVGGAYDMRGWRARNLGPGSLYDTVNISNRSGDLRLQTTIEYTYSISKVIKFALFWDAGNIWMLREDESRPGANITKDFWREIAQNIGAGIRFDFDYFVIRFDLGIPLMQPSLPQGERWFFNKKDQFDSVYGKSLRQGLYNPVFQLGIGYAF